ncbi:MAG: DUF4056 domain-containing protein [bacterium]|nr:DUF4056 domain-containing protein [bacterium]
MGDPPLKKFVDDPKKKFVDDPKKTAVGVPTGVVLEDSRAEDPADTGVEGDDLPLRRRLVQQRYPFLDLDVKEPGARMCCAIGPGGISIGPLYQAFRTEFLSPHQITGHQYGSSLGLVFPDDPIGQIYTARGGFVDLGHVRDWADMTRFLANHAVLAQIEGERLTPGEVSVVITPDGGERRVEFKPTPGASLHVAAMTAARAAYEFAIWHEIVQWYIPRYHSSFSPEDNFSNLLGCLVGAEAMTQPGNFNSMVDRVLARRLSKLEAQPVSITEKATKVVGGVWYDDTIDLTMDIVVGAAEYLLRRHMQPGPTVTPWLVTVMDGRRIYRTDPIAGVTEHIYDFNLGSPAPTPVSLEVPETVEGKTLRDLYDLEIGIDTSVIPRSILPHDPPILSTDLGVIVENVRREVLSAYPNGDQPFYPE